MPSQTGWFDTAVLASRPVQKGTRKIEMPCPAAMDLSDAQAELMSDLPSRKVPLVSPLKVDRKALPLYSTRWGSQHCICMPVQVWT